MIHSIVYRRAARKLSVRREAGRELNFQGLLNKIEGELRKRGAVGESCRALW